MPEPTRPRRKPKQTGEKKIPANAAAQVIALRKLQREEKRLANQVAHALKRAGEIAQADLCKLTLADLVRRYEVESDSEGVVPIIGIAQGILDRAQADTPAAKFYHELRDGPMRRIVDVHLTGESLDRADMANDLVSEIFEEYPEKVELFRRRYQAFLVELGRMALPIGQQSETDSGESE